MVPLGLGMGSRGPVVVGTTPHDSAVASQAWVGWFGGSGRKLREIAVGGPKSAVARSATTTNGISVVCGDTQQWPGGPPQARTAAFLVAVAE